MSTIFTKIIQREIPAYIVGEDDNHIAFLDVSPIALGHTLVVPKQETDLIFDIEGSRYSELWQFAKLVERKLRGAVPCKRVGIAVVGLEVPHAHIHLVPLNTIEDLSFTKPRLSLSDSQYQEIARSIREA